MGTDISFFVERRKKNEWVSCDQWASVTEGDYRGLISVLAPGSAFYDDRNYDLFAILANMRNGYGFAGVDTGDGFNIIAEPRGLPVDMSSDIAELAEWTVDLEYQTASWLTLTEILAFDWSQTTVKRGYVDGSEYEEWISSRRDKRLGPSGHAGGIGPTMTCVSEEDMIETVNAIKGDDPPKLWRPKIKKDLGETFCRLSWETTYAHRAGSFLTETVPRMQKLGSPDNVRCVFWFD